VIIDAHAHIVVAAAAAGRGRAGSWRPQVTEVAGRSRIHHDGRELASVVREFTDPERMAAEAAAQGIGHLLLSPWVRLLPFEHPLAEAREICKVQNDALAALVAADSDRFSALGVLPLQDPVTAARDARWSPTASPGSGSRRRSPGDISVTAPSSRSGRRRRTPARCCSCTRRPGGSRSPSSVITTCGTASRTRSRPRSLPLTW
jgi:hypothetical protein